MSWGIWDTIPAFMETMMQMNVQMRPGCGMSFMCSGLVDRAVGRAGGAPCGSALTWRVGTWTVGARKQLVILCAWARVFLTKKWKRMPSSGLWHPVWTRKAYAEFSSEERNSKCKRGEANFVTGAVQILSLLFQLALTVTLKRHEFPIFLFSCRNKGLGGDSHIV